MRTSLPAIGLVVIALASSCRDGAKNSAYQQGPAPLPATKLSAAVKVLVGNPARGEAFQVAVVGPAGAAAAWICPTAASAPCDKTTSGALSLRAAAAQFELAGGLPVNQHVALTAVAADAAGKVLGAAEASLWLTNAGTAVPDSAGSGAIPADAPALPPPTGLAPLAQVPGASIAYDFRGTLSRPAATAGVVRLVVQSGALKGKTALRLTGTVKNLKHSAEGKPLDLAATADAAGVVDVTVPGLEPDAVYRVEDLALADAAGGASDAVKDPYFLVTAKDGDALARARRVSTLSALAEAYDWDHDNYDKAKQYASRGGWCDMFYSWSTSKAFTIDYPDYAPDYFRQSDALVNDGSAQLPVLAAKEAVHGDMIRYDALFQGNHTFMVLSYDQDTHKLWGVEGNYNNRVERSERGIESGWRLGHLTAAQVKR